MATKAILKIEKDGPGFGRREMTNFKPGMRVMHYQQMNRPGVIVEIRSEKSKQWMIGGTTQMRLIAVIRHDDNSVSNFYTSDLRLEE